MCMSVITKFNIICACYICHLLDGNVFSVKYFVLHGDQHDDHDHDHHYEDGHPSIYPFLWKPTSFSIKSFLTNSAAVKLEYWYLVFILWLHIVSKLYTRQTEERMNLSRDMAKLIPITENKWALTNTDMNDTRCVCLLLQACIHTYLHEYFVCGMLAEV